MIANDNRYSTMDVPALPPDGADLGAYDGTNVAARMGYDDEGSSAADDDGTGQLSDRGDGLAMAAGGRQGGNDDKQERETGQGPAAPSIVGLVARWWRGGIIAQGAGFHDLPALRAGAPTDAGRLPMAIERDGSATDTWNQIDDGMGIKYDTASPLAASPFYADAPIAGGLSSPGGSLPVVPIVDDVQVNTYRTPPTPWDEYNYLGGPFDG